MAAFAHQAGHGLWLSAFGLVCLCVNSAGALEVDDVRWGFDRRVVGYEFNPLSVLVGNRSPSPFEGRLRLGKLLTGGRHIGAVIEKPIYLAPFTSRWVQFYPYVREGYEQWTLWWGDSPGERFTLPQPRRGRPACVILDEPGRLLRSGGNIRAFPEDLFPPLVTATNTLATVVLDHAPRWEPARRRAFLDWLHRGGVIHVLQDERGEFPRFPESLAELNVPRERNRIGAGLVIRHGRPRSRLDPDFVAGAIPGIGRAARKASAEEQAGGYDDQTIYTGWGGDMRLFTNLKSMTQAHPLWFVIYVMSLVYLFVVFPGCYLLGRRLADYRVSLAALLVAVGLFSVVFYVIGRRGGGETSQVRAVAIARPIAGRSFDVCAWSNAAVTAGGDYTISHGGGRLYSTCQDVESVAGVIVNGPNGRMRVDIPPFSSRTFAHRMKAEAAPINLQIVELSTAGDRIGSLVISTDPAGFPDDPHRVVALYGRRFYEMSHQAGRLQLAGHAGTVTGFLGIGQFGQFYDYFDPWAADEEESSADRFAELFVPLVTRSFGLDRIDDFRKFSLPDDRVRVFIYAAMPKEWFVEDERFLQQAGYVLYCLDVLK